MARTVLPVGDRLLELVNARLNGAGVAATARLFATLAAFEPCSFELALAGDRRAFLARAATGAMARQIAAG